MMKNYRAIREGRIASLILCDLKFRGKTKLGHALRENVHRRFFHKGSSSDTALKLLKPALVFTVTDSAPANEPENNLERQIRKTSEYLMD